MRITDNISSRWVKETAVWTHIGYINRKITESFKIIEMEILVDRKILKFIGGPTGFESYNIEYLNLEELRESDYSEFCICGRTVNSWQGCFVDLQSIVRFLDTYRKYWDI